MPGVLDFLFGSGALKKAGGTPPPSPTPSQPAGIDIGKMAQDQADKAKAAANPAPSSGKSPLSSTMTPQTSNGKGDK
jgi:hypothetical protein